MNVIKKSSNRDYWFLIAMLLIAGVFFVLGSAEAATDYAIGSIAKNVTKSMSDIAKLITAGSYVAGFGFAVGAILKFKAHKDNPTQIPVGTPIALIFIAAALIFLPQIFGTTGKTLFGTSGAAVGGATGTASFS